MTRVFVYEYTCAAPPASLEAGGAASLHGEGHAMLQEVLEDFDRTPDAEAFTIRAVPDEERAFRAAVSNADWTLVIAPEFDDILLTRCRWVEEEGGRLLGPSSAGVKLCADKWELAQWWRSRGVRTPHTELWLPHAAKLSFSESTVLKPRFGAGGLHTLLLQSGSHEISSDLRSVPMIRQPLIAGQAASVALLIQGPIIVALRSSTQQFAEGPYCRYLGGTVPLAPDLEMRAQHLATQAVADIPGLAGYVGVDLVLGNDGQDWAIEINPRLTTSYIGLRALAYSNLADAMLKVAQGQLPDIHWRGGSVEFRAAGTVSHVPPS